MASATVTLGVQSGDVPSSETVMPHVMPLRQFLKRNCVGPYGPDIEEFAIVLRISGDLWSFEGDGPERFRINRKGKYITADIVMLKNRWDGVSTDEIRFFLATSIRSTIQTMVDKLIHAGIAVDSLRLLGDLENALNDFQKGHPAR